MSVLSQNLWFNPRISKNPYRGVILFLGFLGCDIRLLTMGFLVSSPLPDSSCQAWPGNNCCYPPRLRLWGHPKKGYKCLRVTNMASSHGCSVRHGELIWKWRIGEAESGIIGLQGIHTFYMLLVFKAAPKTWYHKSNSCIKIYHTEATVFFDNERHFLNLGLLGFKVSV